MTEPLIFFYMNALNYMFVLLILVMVLNKLVIKLSLT